MATHRDKSFIASVTSESGTLGYFEHLYPESFYNPFNNFTWFGIGSDDYASNVLGHLDHQWDVPPLYWYFRSTDTGYAIFVRSLEYFGRFIGYKNSSFSALSTVAEDRSKFQFYPPIAEEPGVGDEFVTSLISLDTGYPLCLRNKSFKYRIGKGMYERKFCKYVTADGGEPIKFRLKIELTNVPYLNNPDEV